MSFDIGSTVTGGIQEVSALLPLLGTEQCEEHVGSALQGGYLYVAAAPLSIFGSLGIAKAGFKLAFASIAASFWPWSIKFIGAKKLAHAGFGPMGKASSLIQWDGNRHKAESAFLTLLDELHLRDVSKLEVASKTRKWNIWMFITSAIATLASITPYIYFIERSHNEPLSIRWIFPLARSLGSLLTATMIQILIQKRILEIVKRRLVFMRVEDTARRASVKLPNWWDPRHASEECIHALERYLSKDDLEAGVRDKLKDALNDAMKVHLPPATITRFRIVLHAARSAIIFGLLLSLAGYIGCFSIVQGNKTSIGPLIWLACEVALSLLRILLWSWNPNWDEKTSLSLSMLLSENSPFPTCNQPTEELDEAKRVPLIRAREFLKSVTSSAGLVVPFDRGTGAVYYTLAGSLETGKKTLYVTIYDYKENLARTLIRRPSLPEVDFHVAYLDGDHATIGEKITERERDHLAAEEPNFFDTLTKHCDSILRDPSSSDRRASVQVSWELRPVEAEDKEPDVNNDMNAHDEGYLMLRKLEMAKTELSRKLEGWIESYMGAVRKEESFRMQDSAGNQTLTTMQEPAAAEVLLLNEQFQLEKNLAFETQELESIIRQHSQNLQSSLEMRDDDDLVRRFENGQRTGAVSRVTAQAKAMEARLKNLDDEIRRRIPESANEGSRKIDLQQELSLRKRLITSRWDDLLRGTETYWQQDDGIATSDNPLPLLLRFMHADFHCTREDRGDFEDLKNRTMAREARMRDRLESTKREMDYRINMASSGCESFRAINEHQEFPNLTDITHLAVGKIINFPGGVMRDTLPAAHRALGENPFVTLIDCYDCHDTDEIIKVVKALKKAKNVSLRMSEDIAKAFIEDSATRKSVDALALHKNILSLGRPLDELPPFSGVIQDTRSQRCKNGPLEFYDGMEATNACVYPLSWSSCYVLQFQSRDNRTWKLQLCHQFRNAEVTISITLNGEDVVWKKNERPVGRFGLQVITLPRNFLKFQTAEELNEINELTITLVKGSREEYLLSDMKLLWRDSFEVHSMDEYCISRLFDDDG